MDLASLLAPYPVDAFTRDIYDRAPLHIPADGEAGERRRALLPWAGMNALLQVTGLWREDNVNLILNGQPVPPDLYLEDAAVSGPVRRASPASLQILLGMGASLVCDGAESAAPALKQVTTVLSSHFLGTSGANIYCSFKGVQAFRTHLDLHDVFALHMEGEKVWRIYEKREPDPVAQLNRADAHQIIEQRRGRLLTEVRMRPGDLLYLPRGYYHDALASSDASLHVTFSVARHTGRILFRLLEELGMEEAAFRAYLPDGRSDGGQVLAERLDALADKAAAIMRSPLFRDALVNRQLGLAQASADMILPERRPLRFFARTREPVRIVRHESGVMLAWSGGQTRLGLLGDAAEWFLSQNMVSLEQLLARYPHHGDAALTEMVAAFQRARLIEPMR